MIIVINGTHVDDGTPRTRWLLNWYDPKGRPVPVYADTILQSYAEAVGPPPQPPWLQAPGGLTPILGPLYDDQGFSLGQVITGYIVDPGPTEYDHAAVESFRSEVENWNNHAAQLRGDVTLLLQLLQEAK